MDLMASFAEKKCRRRHVQLLTTAFACWGIAGIMFLFAYFVGENTFVKSVFMIAVTVGGIAVILGMLHSISCRLSSQSE